MASSVFSRVAKLLLLPASVVSLGACTEMEYAYDRTYQGVGNAFDSVFESNEPPKTSPTKVEVTVPNAAPYQDVRAREIASTPTQYGSEPVELGSMSDRTGLPRDVEPVVPQAPTTGQRVADAQPVMDAPVNPAPIISQPPVGMVAKDDDLGTPLMVVRFNQHHVYYDQALAKAVTAAENARPNAQYHVVSRLPDISALAIPQQQDIAQRSMDNLRDVVTQLQQLGVPANRIKIAKQERDVRSQEIALFVN